jgi:hypothetical protein
MKFVKWVSFKVTGEAPDGSTKAVADRQVCDAIENMLPAKVDGEEWDDCYFAGVSLITIEDFN